MKLNGEERCPHCNLCLLYPPEAANKELAMKLAKAAITRTGSYVASVATELALSGVFHRVSIHFATREEADAFHKLIMAIDGAGLI